MWHDLLVNEPFINIDLKPENWIKQNFWTLGETPTYKKLEAHWKLWIDRFASHSAIKDYPNIYEWNMQIIFNNFIL